MGDFGISLLTLIRVQSLGARSTSLMGGKLGENSVLKAVEQ